MSIHVFALVWIIGMLISYKVYVDGKVQDGKDVTAGDLLGMLFPIGIFWVFYPIQKWIEECEDKVLFYGKKKDDDSVS